MLKSDGEVAGRSCNAHEGGCVCLDMRRQYVKDLIVPSGHARSREQMLDMLNRGAHGGLYFEKWWKTWHWKTSPLGV